MLLSEWKKTAPNRECMSSKVLAVLRPVLADLGAEGDPDSWVLWGDDPEFRYSVLAPTPAGLIVVGLRLGGADGPRANGKLVRWSKVQVSELSVEASGGHRIVAVQVEGQVLKGVDEEADRILRIHAWTACRNRRPRGMAGHDPDPGPGSPSGGARSAEPGSAQGGGKSRGSRPHAAGRRARTGRKAGSQVGSVGAGRGSLGAGRGSLGAGRGSVGAGRGSVGAGRGSLGAGRNPGRPGRCAARARTAVRTRTPPAQARPNARRKDAAGLGGPASDRGPFQARSAAAGRRRPPARSHQACRGASDSTSGESGSRGEAGRGLARDRSRLGGSAGRANRPRNQAPADLDSLTE